MMGLFAALLTPRAQTTPPGPDANLWYQPIGTPSAAGIAVTPETALTFSAIFQGVRLYAETLGSLPLETRRRRGQSKAPDPTADIWSVLHDQPNEWQSAQEWIEFMTGVAVLRGNSFSEIVSGERGFVDQLLPLHPDRVRIERVKGSYRLQYKIKDLDGGGSRTLPRERVFHLRGFGSDGFVGLSVGDLARQAIGMGLAMESYGAKLFSQGVRPSGTMEYPQWMSPEQRATTKAELDATIGGLANAHRPMLLEGGIKWTQIGLTNEDAQFIESRGFQILDVARWLNLPSHMLRIEKQPTFASVEQFAREFVMYSIRPWAHRWRQAIQVQLMTDPELFAEFNLDALLQGTTLDRYGAYRIGLGGRAFLTINEARKTEGLDPDPNPENDTVQQPANVGTLPGDPKMPGAARLDALLEDAAGRAVRRESEAVSKAHARLVGDVAGWRAWVDEFYAKHTQYVSEALKLDFLDAQAFALDHRAALLAEGIAVLETWAVEAPLALCALARETPPSPVEQIQASLHGIARAVARPVRVRVQPAAVTVPVDARTTVEHHAAPVTVAAPPPAAVTVDARTTVAEGAVRVSIPEPAPRTTTVEKTVLRDAQGRPTGTRETHVTE